ncbi:MAG: tRNA (guanosine(46)-N7)-methyltransferase TrmB [Coriobacteriales bacterium]|nr:tRNA (guanosine(46)-N7)-methyltransferase TrmB [Coriobacteriales bacterium]
MRARKPKNVKQKLEAYNDLIISNPKSLKGKWHKYIYELCQVKNIVLDLGCGKGNFALEASKHNNDTAFICIDYEALCILAAVKKTRDLNINNVFFIQANSLDISEIFDDGEIDQMHLNFPTPQPKARHENLRLVNKENLINYSKILKNNSCLYFKTDSIPLYLYAKSQFINSCFCIYESPNNCYDDVFKTMASKISSKNSKDAILECSKNSNDSYFLNNIIDTSEVFTEYEIKLQKKGAKIYSLCARFNNNANIQKDHSKLLSPYFASLYDYLPSDLKTLKYVPYGMDEYVENMLNKNAKNQSKNQQQQEN